jgi:hypothetical protein
MALPIAGSSWSGAGRTAAAERGVWTFGTA